MPEQQKNISRAQDAVRDSATAPSSTSETPLLLDAKSAAQLLGVSESSYWKLHSQGRVPLPLRLSERIVRWRRDELEHWVRAGCPARANWIYGAKLNA